MKKIVSLFYFAAMLLFPISTIAADKVVIIPLLSKSTTFGASLMSATVKDNGILLRGSDNITSSQKGIGVYQVCFPVDITTCQWLVSPGGNNTGIVRNRSAGVNLYAGTTNCLYVEISDTKLDSLANDYFTVLVHCL